ncbi:MAG: arginine--tRNA ligase [Candidatus Binatia bacterium]
MKDRLRSLVRAALERATESGELELDRIPEPHFEVPREQGHGDLATNVAMSLAKSAKRAPREIAEKIVSCLDDSAGLVDRAEIAGPGFINFTLSTRAWRERLVEIIGAGDTYGSSDTGAGERVQVEFVSANPTGPLHIGHGRGAATGDAIARLLEAAGYCVEREYYINDAGVQMQALGRSVHARYLELCGREIVFPEGGYPGEYVIELARELRETEGDAWLDRPAEEAEAYLSRWAGERMLARIRSDLQAFGIEFDHFTSECAIREDGTVAQGIEALEAAGHCFREEGALLFRATAFGDDKDRAVVKGDGELTYFGSDIAYHRAKIERGFDRIVDVWGADHHGYVKRVRAALEAIGQPADRFKVVLVQIVNLTRDGVPVRMGKRTGTFVALSDVVEEVGPDIARFFFLMRKSDAQLDFDLELARRQTAENPVFYVQYAHTRIAGIFRQAEEKGVSVPAAGAEAVAALANADEIGLIRMLDEFPDVVEGAAEAYEPHRVVFYVQRLAGEFHRFYTRNKCVTDDPSTTAARLLLVGAVKQVIGRALRLVGVSAPERM